MKTISIPGQTILLTALVSCASAPPPASPPTASASHEAPKPTCSGVSDELKSRLCAPDEIMKVERIPVHGRSGDTLTGARMVFRPAPGRTGESLQQAVDCEIADASVIAPQQLSPLVSYCPVAIAGVTAVVRTVPEGFAVEVRPRDRAVSQRISHSVVHGSLALALQRFESAECQGIEPKERAACPLLGPVTAIIDTPQGVRVEFPAAVSVNAVLGRMRCHYSFAQTRAFSEEAAACPLYVRGLRLERSGDEKAIDISATPEAAVGALRKSVREEAVFVPGARGAT
jgi:hypothetical protein